MPSLLDRESTTPPPSRLRPQPVTALLKLDSAASTPPLLPPPPPLLPAAAVLPLAADLAAGMATGELLCCCLPRWRCGCCVAAPAAAVCCPVGRTSACAAAGVVVVTAVPPLLVAAAATADRAAPSTEGCLDAAALPGLGDLRAIRSRQQVALSVDNSQTPSLSSTCSYKCWLQTGTRLMTLHDAVPQQSTSQPSTYNKHSNRTTRHLSPFQQ